MTLKLKLRGSNIYIPNIILKHIISLTMSSDSVLLNFLINYWKILSISGLAIPLNPSAKLMSLPIFFGKKIVQFKTKKHSVKVFSSSENQVWRFYIHCLITLLLLLCKNKLILDKLNFLLNNIFYQRVKL